VSNIGDISEVNYTLALMQRLAKLVFACGIFIGIVACRDESPLVSGHAFDGGFIQGGTLVEPGRTPKNWPLSQAQVELLNTWLKEHSSGSSMVVATPPPPSFSVVVRHANGKSSQVDFFSTKNWDKAVVIYAENPANNGIASFSAADLKNLRQQLGEVR
jgi:hypothetical protein